MTAIIAPRKLGNAVDRAAVARKARAIHANRPPMFTRRDWNVQCNFWISNNLTRLTRERRRV